MIDIEPPLDATSSTSPHSRRLRRFMIAALIAAPLLLAGTAWFQPYKLFVDDRVDESAVAADRELARGEFRSLEHDTTGAAVVTVDAAGGRVLRLAELDTSNGPDLRVILSSAALSDDARVWGDDYIEVARLKGNVGSQNYELPADVDLTRYGRVVIWCDRFDVGFGVADLAPAAEVSGLRGPIGTIAPAALRGPSPTIAP
jgi:hypothetical protein